MAIQVAQSNVKPKVGHREKFMERLRLLSESSLGTMKKSVVSTPETGKVYIRYYLMCSYIVIRCYEKYFSVHTNGDIDAYEMKQIKYEDMHYECNNTEFICRLLNDREPK